MQSRDSFINVNPKPQLIRLASQMNYFGLGCHKHKISSSWGALRRLSPRSGRLSHSASGDFTCCVRSPWQFCVHHAFTAGCFNDWIIQMWERKIKLKLERIPGQTIQMDGRRKRVRPRPFTPGNRIDDQGWNKGKNIWKSANWVFWKGVAVRGKQRTSGAGEPICTESMSLKLSQA